MRRTVLAAGRMHLDAFTRWCKKQPSYLYLADSDFWYNNRLPLPVSDTQGNGRALVNIIGQRLIHRLSPAGFGGW